MVEHIIKDLNDTNIVPTKPTTHLTQAKECGFWDDDAVFLPLASDRVGPAKSITLVVRSVLAHGEN